ncbi:chymotrypsin-like protease CTRL-1 [Temnothorax curvispinosus]|uniref:Chymotrypsin-like protease CTRL-1 n=1 Tax=Temnothorax curvispinosus TaxID=300111 RepID=A0A6J1QKN9_9HYME|nr:chymotrypsin-like protease CTRL-1 [Temnothorax curvispinosus]
MVEVQHILGDVNFRSCAGTILSKRWVLIAAHCVGKNPGIFFVYFDVDEFGIEQSIPRPLDGMSMIVTQAFKHPQYAPMNNDIALLYMPQDITFSNNIQPIKIAYYESIRFVTKDAYVVGWRKKNTTSEGTMETMKLKYATLPIIENNVCRQYWPINGNHICTAAELGQFACPERNSNDPLIVRKNGQDFQIGIMMSYEDQSCPDNLFRVYTKVSSYIDWILEVMKRY